MEAPVRVGHALTVLVIAGALALVGVTPATADPIPQNSHPDQSFPIGPFACSTPPATSSGQTFTAGIAGRLTAIAIDVKVNPSITTADTVQVQATTGGFPNGTVLATGVFIGQYQGVVALQVPATIEVGTTYALVMPQGLTQVCSVFDPYPGGSMVTRDGSAPWATVPANDLEFTIYVDYTPVLLPASAATLIAKAVTVPLQESGTVITRALDHAPAYGSVTFSGATATYTPSDDFFGTDTFSYYATNTSGSSAPQTVTVVVTNPAFLPKTGADARPWLLGGLAVLVAGVALVRWGRLRRTA